MEAVMGFVPAVAQKRGRRGLRMAVEERTAPAVDTQWRVGRDKPWRGQNVKYCVANEGGEGTPLVLVHGFGASAEHWRFNVSQLADGDVSRPVYAVDLLGFGRSEKPKDPSGFEGYGVDLWGSQVGEFIQEVVGRPAVVAGNSLGGYSALYAAARFPEHVRGLALVNSAGPTEDEMEARKARKRGGPLARLATFVGFLLLRRPGRVRQVLSAVYTDQKTNVDDDLVNFILAAAFTPGAYEVYYKSTVGVVPGPGKETLLDEVPVSTPITAIWGRNDPWCTEARLTAMIDKCPRIECPHDETPEAFNAKLLEFLRNNGL